MIRYAARFCNIGWRDTDPSISCHLGPSASIPAASPAQRRDSRRARVQRRFRVRCRPQI
jgi:hypothetical protein